MADLFKKYKEEIIPKLEKEHSITNVMAVPKLTKIVVNMGVKDAAVDSKLVDKMVTIVSQITGQKPRVTRAKKSIATFKLREGQPIGVSVTLRGKRMYEFMDRLISIVFPRIKDFRGISNNSFDGRGNYALGFIEYAVFPEIDPGAVDRMQGLEMIFVTTAKNNEEGYALLEAFGVPFKKKK
jgi:large subunit ribosomal protein L5